MFASKMWRNFNKSEGIFCVLQIQLQYSKQLLKRPLWKWGSNNKQTNTHTQISCNPTIYFIKKCWWLSFLENYIILQRSGVFFRFDFSCVNMKANQLFGVASYIFCFPPIDGINIQKCRPFSRSSLILLLSAPNQLQLNEWIQTGKLATNVK